MNTLRKRLLSAMCMVAFGVSFAIAQTNMIKHIVDRGETLASIAKRYATTEAKIIELNPDAAQFLYVGMELTIPVVKDNDVVTEATKNMHNNLVKQNESNQKTRIVEFDEHKFSRWSFSTSIAYGILPKPKGDDVSGNSFTFSFSLGANYHITKSLFIGARLGYNSAYSNTLSHFGVAENYNIAIDNHMIFIPLEIGYRFYIMDNRIALAPYVGLDINCVVKSTIEEGLGSHKKKRSIDPDRRFGANGRIGLRLNLWGIDMGASYVFSFDDNFGENSGFPEISIGYTF